MFIFCNHTHIFIYLRLILPLDEPLSRVLRSNQGHRLDQEKQFRRLEQRRRANARENKETECGGLLEKVGRPEDVCGRVHSFTTHTAHTG